MRIGIPPQYMPLIVWAGLIFALTQAWKWLARRTGIRHHRLVQATLPLVPVALGAASGAAAPMMVGLGAVTGAEVSTVWGAIYGAGAGMVSGHVFAAVRELLPDGVAEALTLPERDSA